MIDLALAVVASQNPLSTMSGRPRRWLRPPGARALAQSVSVRATIRGTCVVIVFARDCRGQY